MRGDPVIINVIRYGDPLIDYGGFFSPLKRLLQDGKIRSTPEAIFTLLQRAPNHMARAKGSLLSAVDGFYWACVDSAHAALISAEILPPSPEHVGGMLEKVFVQRKILKQRYADFFIEVHTFAKDIVHGKIIEVDGTKLDYLKTNTDLFVREMARIVEEFIEEKHP
jgi:uncharacterized protein (UPF0332 family)